MSSVILNKHRDVLRKLSHCHHVVRLEAFGSVVWDDFNEVESDIDLLVEIDADASPSYADDFFGFKESIESLLQRPVDLISLSSIFNPYFLDGIAKDREVIVGG